MAYFLNLFTPETWSAFQAHGSNVSGFRYRQRRMAKEEIQVGDIFLCYLVKLSRWCGALEVTSEAFEDDDTLRFLKTLIPSLFGLGLSPSSSLTHSIQSLCSEDDIWNTLQETKGIEKGSYRLGQILPGLAQANV